uniref:Uncharacterized protein n=1 Tax=Alexandrium catenella TaxID=2925 RepID=A0A7S1WPB1_ALECA|mmetsp:Transcript_78141/g.207378  ORF Transcript_78141/g.207378 Transcript_78141/m.207378 type:complete len:198 (+) Transcript_78141:65-658(+)|eukprot:CAMPEP_0171162458 /NCGR_PEP_ID=MMETSP0790-20130122/4601_1 /TAXON_ID=2925 /ORGANISM="Alexandrium catenella, Strain OF101" /LENGTH=197 /DNA_ID=CAMNT_0011627059 /DNA_START=64 /DNA_END=657 /DNA_ORIENTATION=-
MAPHYSTEDDAVKGNSGLLILPCFPCFPIVNGAELDKRETKMCRHFCGKIQDVADESTSLTSFAVVDFFTFGEATRTKGEVTDELKKAVHEVVPGVIQRAARRFHVGFWLSLSIIVVIIVVCRHSGAATCWPCRTGFFWVSWILLPIITYLTVRPVLGQIQAEMEAAGRRAEKIVEDKIPDAVIAYSEYLPESCAVM